MGYCDERPMDSIRCNKDSFSKPMPWIGIYIATASLLCTLAMAADTVRGFHRRKLWFPSKFFALNAASLTVLGVAIKLALDLNNPMPGSFDQFSKLSSVVFMATSMANFMPSLGDMNNIDVLMNMTALGEDLLPEVMAENKNVLCKFFQKGVNQQPEQLLNLLQKTTSNFNGVAKFDSNKDISRYPQVLPNCWKLPVITLTSIAIALMGSRAEGVENLRRSVSQSLKYVSIVDEILDPKGLFKRVRDAADEAWSDLHLSGKFLNEDLRQMGCEGNTSKGVLSKLCDIARDYISENVKRYKHCSRWPNKLIAAYSMQRISYSVLSEKLENESLFEHISVMIADILGACLTNLPEAITAKCSSVSIEKREETVQKMAHIIGETEEILKVLQKHRLPDLATKRVDIDEWRRSLMGMSPSVSSSLLVAVS